MAFSVIPIWWGLKIPCSVYFRTIHWYLVDIYRGKEIGLMSYWYLPGGLEEMSRSTTFTRASFGIGDRIIYRGCLISYTIRLLRPWGLDGFIWTVYCLMMVWNMNFIVPYIGNVIIQLTNSYFSEELKPPSRWRFFRKIGWYLSKSTMQDQQVVKNEAWIETNGGRPPSLRHGGSWKFMKN